MKKHKLILRKAKQLDKWIDSYRAKKRLRTFPRKKLSEVIQFIFPGSTVSGEGRFKIVHKISARTRELVLKTGNENGIKSDMRVYKRLPKGKRNRYFAKVYWITKYCLLQKYGDKADVPEAELAKLKKIGEECGLKDIRPVNIRRVSGRFKIVDASLRKK